MFNFCFYNKPERGAVVSKMKILCFCATAILLLGIFTFSNGFIGIVAFAEDDEYEEISGDNYAEYIEPDVQAFPAAPDDIDEVSEPTESNEPIEMPESTEYYVPDEMPESTLPYVPVEPSEPYDTTDEVEPSESEPYDEYEEIEEVEPYDVSIEISGVFALDRTYDGGVVIELGGGELQGVAEHHDVDFILGYGTIATRHVGENLEVTVSIILSGSDSERYILNQPSGITVNISPLPITVTSIEARPRFFTFTNMVTLSEGTLKDVLPGDDVSFVLGDGVAVRQRRGEWAVETDITLTGSHASNYTLIQPENIRVEIFVGLNMSIILLSILCILILSGAALLSIYLIRIRRKRYRDNSAGNNNSDNEAMIQDTNATRVDSTSLQNTSYHIRTDYHAGTNSGESESQLSNNPALDGSPSKPGGIVLLNRTPTPIINAESSTESISYTKHKLYLTKNAVKELQRFICWGESNHLNKNEQQGILAGHIVHDIKNGFYIGVVESVILSKAQGSAAYVESSHSEWNDMVKELDGLNIGRSGDTKLIKVGWWHTHPNMGVFMSGTDTDTQKKYYNKDWQFAIVLNPQGKRWGVFVGANATPCEGFFLI